MTHAGLVTCEIADGLATLTIDNPPVNALSYGVREALMAALTALRGRHDISTIILTGRGSTFIAGADINEMDAPPERPFLPELTDAIMTMPMPVIAAINGTCLGGGAEIAFACDARYAVPKALIGLPETKLGIIPGAGGTQFLPRLIGLERAIEMVCEGRLVKAGDPEARGLVDAVVDDAVAHARVAARTVVKRDLASWTVPEADEAALDRLAARISSKHRRSDAVMSALNLMRATGTMSFVEGIVRERATFLRLRASAAAQALRYLFKAEREASRGLPGAGGQPVTHVGVAGGGTMGSGIALSFVQAGFQVIVLERDAGSSNAAQQRMSSMISALVDRDRIPTQEAGAYLARIGFDHDLAAAGNCKLVVEAVFEDYEAKQALFNGLAPHLRPGTIVASNTSYLDIDRLAAMLPEPVNVLGMHFFAPANIMKLVEVVRGAQTDPSAIATVIGLCRRLGKVPVIAGNAEGFIGNRIFSAYRRAMEYLVEDGASPKEIDEALEEYGFAMGPFSVFDMSGLDIAWAMRKRKAAERDPQERYVRIADRLCEAGLFGRKTGCGWYDHSAPTRSVSDEAAAFIDEERKSKGIAPRRVSAKEIVDAALSAMALEGKALLTEGVAARASDIDVVLVTGYGFPPDRGGPMYACGLI